MSNCFWTKSFDLNFRQKFDRTLLFKKIAPLDKTQKCFVKISSFWQTKRPPCSRTVEKTVVRNTTTQLTPGSQLYRCAGHVGNFSRPVINAIYWTTLCFMRGVDYYCIMTLHKLIHIWKWTPLICRIERVIIICSRLEREALSWLWRTSSGAELI